MLMTFPLLTLHQNIVPVPPAHQALGPKDRQAQANRKPTSAQGILLIPFPCQLHVASLTPACVTT